MINYGIVICSRLDSSRIKEKCFFKFIGIPLLEHLLGRLKNFPVFLAVPQGDRCKYAYLTEMFPNVKLDVGVYDPMHRMYGVARKYGIENVIRICHDKIFVDEGTVSEAINTYKKEESDYLYSSHLTDGTGFEIISTSALAAACIKYKESEHISYAVRAVASKVVNFMPSNVSFTLAHRLLIDYPEDLAMINMIFCRLGKDATLEQVIDFLTEYASADKTNRQPELTIYTCVHNGEKYIAECVRSVMRQKDFKNFEYIIVDDCSYDETMRVVNNCISGSYKNIRILRNPVNVGLAASSNLALEAAKGKYIMRLDADDYFQYPNACSQVLEYTKRKGYDAVYVGNQLQNPRDVHHIGGTVFNRKEINYIKFDGKLRGLEGYDFFLRAKNVLNIGYFYKPLWFYRQRQDSMSNTNLEKRMATKAEIEAIHGT